MKVRLFHTALILFFLSETLFGSPGKFYSINSLFDISMRQTNSICKDNNGFTWASSKTGILRIIKDDYRIYQIPYESANVTSVNLIYVNSGLFAYTNNGQIFAYNSVYDQFELFLNLSKALNNNFLAVKDLLIDPKGSFWISTSDGLYKYQSGILKSIFNKPNQIFSIIWYDELQIILASSDGIWLLNANSLEVKNICENKNAKRFEVSTLFFEETQNKLWIGSVSDGLFLFDFNTGYFSKTLESVLPKQPVRAIEEITDSTCLIGIDGQGIWEVSKRNYAVLNVYKEESDNPSSIKGNEINDIFCDREMKRVWVCTLSGGVFFYNQTSPVIKQIVHQINNPNSLTNDVINCVIEDSFGKLWFATNKGICCWDPRSNHWNNLYCKEKDQTPIFLSLCEDNKGRIWAGSYSSGVFVLDVCTGIEIEHYKNDKNGSPMVGNLVPDIYKDSDGDIWISGLNSELFCYQAKGDNFRTYSKIPVNVFYEFLPGQILLGGTYGLSLLDKKTGEVKKLLEDILIQDIIVIDQDVWICTSGNGLIKYNYKSGSTDKFTTETGLPSNFVNSLEFDNNYLWLGTEIGLCRFNPTDFEVLTFISINPLSGLSYNNNSSYRTKNAQLAWGTNSGAILIDPESIKENPPQGRIFFQDLLISGHSVRKTPSFHLATPVDSLKSIKLDYSQNNLSLELLSIGTRSVTKLSWKLENFDKNFTLPAENKFITYTNIPSGKFNLKIKLYNCSLTQVVAERDLLINIVPPFWKRSWFIILLLIFISGIIFIVFLYYANLLRRKHTEEKIRFFTNTAHEIRTSLTLIKAPIEELAKESEHSPKGRKYLNLALEQARQLSLVVTQLMDFQKVDVGKEKLSLTMTDIVELFSNRVLMFDSLAKKKRVEIEFYSDKQSYKTAIDEQKIDKIVDNLLINAIKYSHPNSKVRIDLKCGESKWVLKVVDHGIGISRKAQLKLFKEFYRGENAMNSKTVGSGIGLILVKKYISMHGGHISCESQENVGSTFQATIPFKDITDELIKAEPILEAQNLYNSEVSGVQQIPEIPKIHPSNEMKVLVVEDNNDLLIFMQGALSDEFTVYTAEDGVKAWKFILKQIPDLIISDVMMPNMDGYQLCKLIKSTYETSHIPVILLTALSEKTDQLHGLGLGADDYIIKPFDIALLVQRVKTIVKNREIIREKALRLIKVNAAEPLFTNELNDKFVKRMLEVIWSNISNPGFGKDEFASEMNVSSSLLYKKIKSITGLSPIEFIKTVRLNHAMDLLHTHKYTINDISEQCGFANASYFSTVFKKHFGKTASETEE